MINRAMALLTGLGYEVKDADLPFLEIILEDIVQEIKNFLHRKDLPKEAEPIVAKVCAGRFLLSKKQAGALSDGQEEGAFSYDRPLKAKTMGDYKVEYQDYGQYTGASPESKFEDLIGGWSVIPWADLQHWRRIKWKT